MPARIRCNAQATIPGSSPAAIPHGQWMIAIEQAREEYITIVAKLRLKTAKKAFVPKSPPLELKYGDKVLVYHKKSEGWNPALSYQGTKTRSQLSSLTESPNHKELNELASSMKPPYSLLQTYTELFLANRRRTISTNLTTTLMLQFPLRRRPIPSQLSTTQVGPRPSTQMYSLTTMPWSAVCERNQHRLKSRSRI